MPTYYPHPLYPSRHFADELRDTLRDDPQRALEVMDAALGVQVGEVLELTRSDDSRAVRKLELALHAGEIAGMAGTVMDMARYASVSPSELGQWLVAAHDNLPGEGDTSMPVAWMYLGAAHPSGTLGVLPMILEAAVEDGIVPPA